MNKFIRWLFWNIVYSFRRQSPVPARTIPAQPERTESVEKDICGACEIRLPCNRCVLCGRRLCTACCRGLTMRTCGRKERMACVGFSGVWCPPCMRLWSERYGAELSVLRAKHREEEDQLRARWKAESLAITETEETTL